MLHSTFIRFVTLILAAAIGMGLHGGARAASDLDRASRALELYLEFSETLPERQMAQHRDPISGDMRNSGWYYLGTEVLTASSRVLLSFGVVPKSQRQAADKIATLRLLIRSIAAWLQRYRDAPVRDWSYSSGIGTPAAELGESENVWICRSRWGELWQDRFSDPVLLYYMLFDRRVFVYDFVAPPPPRPGTGAVVQNMMFPRPLVPASSASPSPRLGPIGPQRPSVQAAAKAPQPVPPPPAPTKAVEPPPENLTNIITVDAFSPFPYDRIHGFTSPQPTLAAQRWTGGKLVIGFHYQWRDSYFDGKVKQPVGGGA